MKIFHKIKRFKQTTDFNCGPAALAQLFSFYGNQHGIEDIEELVKISTEFGTYDGYLGKTAIDFGYKVKLTPQNLYAFDPTWFKLTNSIIVNNLRDFRDMVTNKKLKYDIEGFEKFLTSGGKIDFAPLSKELLIYKLKKYPILIGICPTYLQGWERPLNPETNYREGHFVVINGYDSKTDKFSVVDPWHSIPSSKSGRYRVKSDRLIQAMFLAEATYDCTILELWK